MTLLRILLALGGLALLVSIIWASQAASIGASFTAIAADPWGIVALIDLYLGFVFLGIIIWMFERNKLIALIFILPLPFLGNVWAAVWIVWRLAALATRLRPA